MRHSCLFCIFLVLVAPFSAEARKHRDHSEIRAFKSDHPCPATGLVESSCRGWDVGYIVPLCANGLDKRENMRWITQEDKRFLASANGKDCLKLNRSTNLQGPDPAFMKHK